MAKPKGKMCLLRKLQRSLLARFIALFLFIANSFLFPYSAFAEYTDPFYYIKETVPGEHYMQVNDSTNGAFSYSYQIASPPGRLSAQPNIQLNYSSSPDKEGSILGYGWSVNIPYIERINKIGVDKMYDQQASTTYFYSTLSGELAQLKSTSTVGSFLSYARFAPLLSFVSLPRLLVLEDPLGISSGFLQLNSTSSENLIQVEPPINIPQVEHTLITPTVNNDILLSEAKLVFDNLVRPDGLPLKEYVEIPSLLTEHSRTYTKGYDKNGSKLNQTVIYNNPIAYSNDLTGRLEPIDFSLSTTSNGWVSSKNIFTVELPSKTFETIGVLNYKTLSFAIRIPHDSQQGIPVYGEMRGNKVLYRNLAGKDVDIEMVSDAGFLRKDIIINNIVGLADLNPRDSYDLTFELSFSKDIDLYAGEKMLTTGTGISTNEQVAIKDLSGNTIYIPPVMAYGQAEPGVPISITLQKASSTGILITKHIPISWLQQATFPIRTDLTITPYSGNGDGVVDALNAVSFSAARNATVGTNAYPSATDHYIETNYAGSNYIVRRGFLPFDTSSLPDDASIASSTLLLNIVGAYDSLNDGLGYLSLTQATQTSTSTLSTSDFSHIISTFGSATRTISSFATGNTYNAITLNNTGLNWINKAGWTNLGVRLGHDIENISTSNDQYVRANFSESGLSYTPILVVEYNIATPNAPTGLQVESRTNPVSVATLTPRFSAIFEDSIATDTAQYYQVQVTSSSTSWLSPFWDSGKLTLSSSTPVGSRTPQITATTSFPLDGTTYYWRIKFWDQLGYEGAWSNTVATFRTQIAANYEPRVKQGNDLSYTLNPDNTWSAYDKRGTLYKFGVSTTSRIFNQSTTSEVYRWLLEETRDTNGNTARYNYATDSTNQLYPYQIDYSSNGAQSPIHQIQFVREDRLDISTSSSAGFPLITAQRLKEIRVRTNNQLIHRYQLGYTTGANGVRSLLSSITESGWDSSIGTTTLPATTFVYSSSTPNWTQNTNGALWNLPGYFTNGTCDCGWRTADVNGDGLTDIILSGAHVYNTYINNGNDWVLDSTWALPTEFTDGTTYEGTELADVNGDGLIDVIHAQAVTPNNMFEVYLNTGTGWSLSSSWKFPEVLVHDGTPTDLRIADVNGDGLPDVINGTIGTYINTGSAWVLDTTWKSPHSFTDGIHDWGYRLADINGDGLIDILSGAYPAKDVYLNTGHGWKQEVSWQLPDYFTNGVVDLGLRIVDANADGLLDLAKYIPTTPSYTNLLYLNTGTGWAIQSTSTWWVPSFTGYDNHDYGGRYDDINGDGLTDMLVSYSTSATNIVLLKNGQKPDTLTLINNDKGGKTKILYQSSAAYKEQGQILNPKLPFILQTVQSLAQDNGYGAIATTTFVYAGGTNYFSSTTPTDRRFAGFASSSKSNSLGHTTRTSFHQGNGSNTAYGEYNDHMSKIGKPYLVETLNGTSTGASVLIRTINKWVRTAFADGRDIVTLSKTLTQTIDGDSSHKDVGQSHTYDDLTGNIVESVNYGEVNGSTDGTFSDLGMDLSSTTYSYAASSTNSKITLLTRELTTDQQGQMVSDSKSYYDDLSYGVLSKGNTTREEKARSTSTYILRTKQYNLYGLVTSESDPRGATTTYSYDQYNLFVATATNPLGQTKSFTYDYSSGKIATMTDENGRVFVNEYDGLDRLIKEKQPDFGNPSTLVTKSTYTYTDSTTTLSSIFQSTILSSSITADTYTYLDGFGRIIQTKQEAEPANGWVAVDTIYNATGQVGSLSLPYFSTTSSKTNATTAPALFSNFSYDALGRNLTIADANGTTTNTYQDWRLTTIDPLGNKKEVLKDALGNLSSVIEYPNGPTTLGATTSYLWNLNGKLTQLTDALGNVRNFAYDTLGRLTASEDLHQASDTVFGTTSRSYDDAGNLITLVTPRAKTVTYSYDALNRIAQENESSNANPDIVYTYDTCTNGKGRLCQVQTHGAATTTFSYNPIGLQTTETVKIGTTTMQIGTTTKTYFRNGSIDTIVYPDASLVGYTYDAAGLLDQMSRKESGGASSTVISKLAYAPTGKQSVIEYANGMIATSTYDQTKTYRLASKVVKALAGIVENDTYTYDAVGNITQFSNTASSTLRKSVTYTYDNLYRLLSASTTAVATGTTAYFQQFTYDVLGNILTSPAGTYAYSGAGYANPDAVTEIGQAVTGTATATPQFVQSRLNTVSGSTTNSVLLQNAVTSGNLIVVGITVNNQTLSANAITDNKGNTYTKAAEAINGLDHAALFYAKNVTGGSNLRVSANIGDNTLSVQEYTNIDVSAPLDKVASSTGTSNTPSTGNLSASVGNELFVGIAWSRGHLDSWTARNGYSKREEQLDDNTYERQASEDTVISTASTSAALFQTTTAANWAMAGASFKPKATTGGGLATSTPTLIQSAIDSAGSGSVTLGSTVTGGNAIVVGFTYCCTTLPANAITDNKGNTYIKVGEATSNQDHGAIYYAANVTGGSSFTISSSIGGTISAHEYQGIASTSPLEASAFGSGTSTSLSSSSTSTREYNALAFGLAWSMQDGDSWTPGSGYTLRTQETNNTTLERHASEEKVVASPGSVAATFSVPTSSGWLAGLALFRPSRTGGGSTYATTSYTYDQSGNLVNVGQSTHTWNYRDRLVQSTLATSTLYNLYDQNDTRVYTATSTANPRYFFGNTYEVWGNKKTKHLYANGGLVGTVETVGSTASPYFQLTDLLESSTLSMNASGTVVVATDYTPFGEARVDQKSTAFAQDRKFIGQPYDDATSLSYLNARYYDGGKGKFISQDPVARDIGMMQKMPPYILALSNNPADIDQTYVLSNPQVLNSYSYSLNNPINYSDPSGKCPICLIGLVVAAGVFLDANTAGAPTMDNPNPSTPALSNVLLVANLLSPGGAEKKVGTELIKAGETIAGLKVTTHGAETFAERSMNVNQITTALKEGVKYLDSKTDNLLHVVGERGKGGYTIVTDKAQKVLVSTENFVRNLTPKNSPTRFIKSDK